MFLIFDTETTGLPDAGYDYKHTEKWPRIVQLAWQLHDEYGRLLEKGNEVIKPEGFTIPYAAQDIHGISTELAEKIGKPLEEVLDKFFKAWDKAEFIVGHNLKFDLQVIAAELLRKGNDEKFLFEKKILDTAAEYTAEVTKIERGKGKTGRYKIPKLEELYAFLFNENLDFAHNASADVEANARVFFELIRRGDFPPELMNRDKEYIKVFREFNPEPTGLYGIRHYDFRTMSAELIPDADKETGPRKKISVEHFCHLHNYSLYSMLQSTVRLEDLVRKAIEEKMPAIALTDKHYLMGMFYFFQYLEDYNQKQQKEESPHFVKPIAGIELYVAEDMHDRSRKDFGRPVVLLAKNKTGYQNLVKLTTMASVEGFYNNPRVDMEAIRKHSEGLMMLTGGMDGETAQLILEKGEDIALDRLLRWKEIFGDDLYLEVMRHGLDKERAVNEIYKRWSKEYGIKPVATNHVHYLTEEEAEIHEILLAVKNGNVLSDPAGEGWRYRKKLPNNQYYFKPAEEMGALFADWPEAIENIHEVIDKVEVYSLKREVAMPRFEVPEAFRVESDPEASEKAYLRHLVEEGAKRRWKTITPAIRKRLDYELDVIEKLGFVGYFLIVQDVMNKAREMGVFVGAGRGSAAGSAVSYTLNITNVDPIKYDLLFERFLNPDRKSLPDIDMDFDDIGRSKVAEYVVQKYGEDKVAHITTYGIIKAKTAIRDTFRVLELPLDEANRLAKLAPSDKLTLKEILELSPAEIRQSKVQPKELPGVLKLKEIVENDPKIREVIAKASQLEGSIRQPGVHAAGFIISPIKIDEIMPLYKSRKAKDELLITQYDKDVVELAGLIKMDFLGIRTLSIVKDALRLIKERHGVNIDIDALPLDDSKTYELFQRGLTVGIFQFESAGMRKYLKQLKPTEFEDLVAMVALYRPGPMEKIPNYINRKFGLEPVTYDLPEMEEYLKSSYGITIYQEQVMLLSQKLAGFTGGEADNLRKAMGKKKKAELDKLYPKFIKGGMERGHPKEILEKIWKDWEAFASYAFNRSHAVSYAILSYQTGYLKANYPAEFLASSMSHHSSNIKKLSVFLEDAKNWNLKVLPPDVNASFLDFAVDEEGHIRYGLASIKGVGEKAVESIVNERENNGKYKDIYDFVERVDLSTVNARVMENLAKAGAFDTFGFERYVYFCTENNETSFIEHLIKYGKKIQKEQLNKTASLFDGFGGVEIAKPPVPKCGEGMSDIEKLEIEKELMGLYISGHPLDKYKQHLKIFTDTDLNKTDKILQAINEKKDIPLYDSLSDDENEEDDMEWEMNTAEDKDEEDEDIVRYADARQYLNAQRRIRAGGMIIKADIKYNKDNKPYAIVELEDYEGKVQFFVRTEVYSEYKALLYERSQVAVDLYVEEDWRNKGQYRLVPKAFYDLKDLMEKHVSSLRLYFNDYHIGAKTADDLIKILKKYPGKQRVEIVLKSSKWNMNLYFYSREIQVEIRPELLEALDQLEFEYKVIYSI